MQPQGTAVAGRAQLCGCIGGWEFRSELFGGIHLLIYYDRRVRFER
jgi:hypothetical protein